MYNGAATFVQCPFVQWPFVQWTFFQWDVCPMGRLSNGSFVQWDVCPIIYKYGHLSNGTFVNNDSFFNNPFVQYYINFDICPMTICYNCQLYQENILGLYRLPLDKPIIRPNFVAPEEMYQNVLCGLSNILGGFLRFYGCLKFSILYAICG